MKSTARLAYFFFAFTLFCVLLLTGIFIFFQKNTRIKSNISTAGFLSQVLILRENILKKNISFFETKEAMIPFTSKVSESEVYPGLFTFKILTRYKSIKKINGDWVIETVIPGLIKNQSISLVIPPSMPNISTGFLTKSGSAEEETWLNIVKERLLDVFKNHPGYFLVEIATTNINFDKCIDKEFCDGVFSSANSFKTNNNLFLKKREKEIQSLILPIFDKKKMLGPIISITVGGELELL